MSEFDGLYHRVMGDLDALRQRNAEERARLEQASAAHARDHEHGARELERTLRAVGERALREPAPAGTRPTDRRPADLRPIDLTPADIRPSGVGQEGLGHTAAVEWQQPSLRQRGRAPIEPTADVELPALGSQLPAHRSPGGLPIRQRAKETFDRYVMGAPAALSRLATFYHRDAKPFLQGSVDRGAVGPVLQDTFRRHILAIGATAVVLVIGLGGWAATTEFSGAVIAQGQIVVDSNVKKVQHPTGGIIGDLRVRDGVHVKSGDIVARLDDTQTRANLLIIVKSLDEMTARQTREEAERDGMESLDFPSDLLARMEEPDVAKAVNGERKQFNDRRTAREGLKGQLRERIAQSKEEITGYTAQISSKENQIDWIKKELVGVNDLWKKGLVPYTRVTALEREKERLEGERGQTVAAIAQAKGKITETELQILQVDQDMRTEVGKDLADIRGKVAELVEKKVAAEDQLRRVDMRSPIDGVVHQLSVYTVGGVIGQGEVVMLIVPESDALDVEAKIQPQDIDQLRLGQLALVRLTAFNQRTTPELNGTVSRISADVSEDQKTGAKYYTIRITVPETEIARLKGLQLVPGMPAEAFVQTNPRTVMTYLTRPLHDQLVRTFREK